MKKLYKKSELGFALLWIGLYVVVMNIALQFSGGFDDLAGKTPVQLLVPVVCILLLAASATLWILRSGLGDKYGLCRFKGSPKLFLWFIPLAVMSCTNLQNGLTATDTPLLAVLMAINMAVAGFVEELLFRGFLFRAMAKENVKSAVIVSAVTFGVGHIVNLFNTDDTLSVLLQVCYAVVIGFLFTLIVWKGGSLWPCIASHMFVNGTSVFAREEGAFSHLVAAVFGKHGSWLPQLCSAVLVILISGGYALWLHKKAPTP